MEPRDVLKDTIGDLESARYGHPNERKVPRFRREGSGRVLGLDSSLKIVPNNFSNDIEIGPGGRKRARYTDKLKDRFIESPLLKSWSKESYKNFDADQNVIWLSHEDKLTKKDEETEQYSGHLHFGTDEWRPDTHDDDRSNGGKGTDDENNSEQDELKGKLKKLDSKVRADPSDVDSWLALVSVQKDLMEAAQQNDRNEDFERYKKQKKLQWNQSQLLAEVQFSVLERAINENPNNSASLPLIKARLKLAASSKAWDEGRIEKEWKDTIMLWSNDWQASINLWNEYLSWKLQNIDTFVLEDVLRAFVKSIKALRKFFYNSFQMEGRVSVETEMIQLFAKAVELMLDAGFSERARGVLQAQIELSSCLWKRTSEPTEEIFNLACEDIERYWDQQENRIGEDGYKSLSCLFQKGKKDVNGKASAHSKETKSIRSSSIPEGLSDSDPIMRWLALEKARFNLRKWPAKWNEEADWLTGELEVDPFSFVLYSDIEAFLMPVTTRNGLESIVELLLASVGVHGSSNSRNLINSYRFWPEHLSTGAQASSFEFIDGELMSAPKKSVLSHPFQMPIKIWPEHLSTLYPVQNEQNLPWFSLWGADSFEKEDYNIARLIFQQIEIPSIRLDMAHLGLVEVTQKHKFTIRLAKLLLDNNRDDNELWRTYAQLEKNNGNIESARVVYKSLIGAEKSFSSKNLDRVWADWAEMEFEAGRDANALVILALAAVSNFGSVEQEKLSQLTAASSTDVLRAKRAILSKGSDPSTSSATIYCAALFHYLTNNEEEAFDSAMQIFNNAMNTIQSESALELIAMTHCKFIWRHIFQDKTKRGSRSYIPKQITKILSTYVLQFKSNTAFVALLAAFEMKNKVESTLRNVLEKKMQILGEASREADWLVYIYCELHMNMHTVNENAIRNLFERAISATSTSSSSTLWQMFLQYEVQIAQRLCKSTQDARARYEGEPDKNSSMKENLKADERRSRGAMMKAKGILYRAIEKVPYCKALYLTAFTPPLRRVFSNDELLQLSHIMQEKDLRFYTNLDAFLEPTEESSSSSSSLSSESHQQYTHI